MSKIRTSLESIPLSPVHPYRRRAFIAAVILLAAFLGTLLWWGLNRISPLPPKRIVMTTGAAGSAYQKLAERYRDLLARDGVTVELRSSEMVPLIRLAPSAYAWRIQRRILGLYTELRLLELEANSETATTEPADLAARIDRLDRRAHEMKLPVAYSPMLYTLRDHIVLVRQRMEKA